MATIREIDAWLLSHHGSATDCARALEPDADEAAFRKLRSRCSQQVQRLRASGALPPSLAPRAAVPAPAPEPKPEPPPRPAPALRQPVKPKPPKPEPLRLVEQPPAPPPAPESPPAAAEPTPRERRRAVIEAERQRRQAAADATDRVDLGSLDRVGFLRWRLQQLELAVAGGDVGSVARVQALKSADETHAALLVELNRTDEVEERLVDLTPEEWAAKVQADARACADVDLDVYLREYARRHKLEPYMVDGLPAFRRRSA